MQGRVYCLGCRNFADWLDKFLARTDQTNFRKATSRKVLTARCRLTQFLDAKVQGRADLTECQRFADWLDKFLARTDQTKFRKAASRKVLTAKCRLTQYLDARVQGRADRAECQSFADWLDKFLARTDQTKFRKATSRKVRQQNAGRPNSLTQRCKDGQTAPSAGASRTGWQNS